MDAARDKKAAFLQTNQGKKWQGMRKNNKNREIMALEEDKGHNKWETHLNQDKEKRQDSTAAPAGGGRWAYAPAGRRARTSRVRNQQHRPWGVARMGRAG